MSITPSPVWLWYLGVLFRTIICCVWRIVRSFENYVGRTCVSQSVHQSLSWLFVCHFNATCGRFFRSHILCFFCPRYPRKDRYPLTAPALRSFWNRHARSSLHFWLVLAVLDMLCRIPLGIYTVYIGNKDVDLAPWKRLFLTSTWSPLSFFSRIRGID